MSCRLHEMRTISNPLAVEPSDRRVERLFRTINLRASFSPALNAASAASVFLSKAGNNKLNLPGFYLGCRQYYSFNIFHFVALSPVAPPPQWWMRFGSSRRCCSCCTSWSCRCWTQSSPLLKGFGSDPARLRWPVTTWLSPTPAWKETSPTRSASSSQDLTNAHLSQCVLFVFSCFFLTTFFPPLQVGLLVVGSSRLPRTVSRPADYGHRGTTQPP